MLVLSRKVGEQIILGTNIAITVLAVRGTQVKLGIAAPDDVAIRRRELCFELPADLDFQECVSNANASRWARGRFTDEIEV